MAAIGTRLASPHSGLRPVNPISPSDFTFGDVFARLVKESGALAVAIVRDGMPITNPPVDTQLAQSDTVIALFPTEK